MRFITWILFFCGLIQMTASAQSKLNVVGEISDDQGYLEGVIVEIERDSSIVASYRTDTAGKFNFLLDYGNYYLITFTKRGFTEKKIIVDTDLPEKKHPDLFQLVNLRLRLIESLGESILDAKPLGKVAFNRTTKEFDYTSMFEKNQLTNVEMSGVDYYISKREQEISPGENPKELAQKAQLVASQQEKKKELFFQEIKKKRRDFLSDAKDTIPKDSIALSALKEIPLDTSVSYYSHHNMNITEVILNNEKILRVYHRVKHNWGGVFYFKNYRAISRTLFFLETKLTTRELTN